MLVGRTPVAARAVLLHNLQQDTVDWSPWRHGADFLAEGVMARDVGRGHRILLQDEQPIHHLLLVLRLPTSRAVVWRRLRARRAGRLRQQQQVRPVVGVVLRSGGGAQHALLPALGLQEAVEGHLLLLLLGTLLRLRNSRRAIRLLVEAVAARLNRCHGLVVVQSHAHVLGHQLIVLLEQPFILVGQLVDYLVERPGDAQREFASAATRIDPRCPACQ
mmetsp:Transcript_58826/g.151269  ORF Transcript_58826/g.151269 Transcript_58826/m.151269 type:complete len:218 (-) Transcript_58826:97-750(-)